MIATIPYINQKYRLFNTQIFSDALPEIPIALSKSRHYPGQVCFKRHRHLLKGDSVSDLCLKISTLYDFEESDIEDVIIHEMIHCYILTQGLHDSSAHGVVFRRFMSDINSRFGRHITISHRLKKDQAGTIPVEMKPKTRTVALVSLKDGRRGIKVLPGTERSIRAYTSGIRRHFNVDSVKLYRSNDPFFAGFPSSSALRIYLLNEDDIQRHFTNNTAHNDK